METPVSRPIKEDHMPSAMKCVVLTSTGEILATPTSAELVDLFKRSLKVGLNFGKIFDFEEGDSREKESQERHEDGAASPPARPPELEERGKDKDKNKEDSSSGTSTESSQLPQRHLHRQGFVVLRYVHPLPTVRRTVNPRL
jgi:hypothetical protein